MRRLILVAGAALLIAGVIGLFMPVSVSGNNEHIGCGSAAVSELSAAHNADNRSGANIPVLSQVLPHTDYVSQCQSSLSTRRAWTIPMAVFGVLAIAGSFLVHG